MFECTVQTEDYNRETGW